MQNQFLNLCLFGALLPAMACNSGKNVAGSCIDPNKINPDAACIEVYDPVCGCDGKTYSNSCFASIAGVTSYQPGECPQK